MTDNGSALAALEARASDLTVDRVAERIVRRYVRLMARELAALSFSSDEALALLNAVHAVREARREGGAVPTLGEAAATACRSGLSYTHRIHASDLLARLDALTPSQTLAVLDATERLRAASLRSDRPAWERIIGELGSR